MALAAARLAPKVQTAFALIRSQRMAQRSQQFDVAPGDKVIQRGYPFGGNPQ
jgi:hypothetical protein